MRNILLVERQNLHTPPHHLLGFLLLLVSMLLDRSCASSYRGWTLERRSGDAILVPGMAARRTYPPRRREQV